MSVNLQNRDLWANYYRTWIYFPKREELSFRVVLAFPNDSRMGLVANI